MPHQLATNEKFNRNRDDARESYHAGSDKSNKFKFIALSDNCVWIRRVKETKKSKKYFKQVIHFIFCQKITQISEYTHLFVILIKLEIYIISRYLL